MKNIMIIIGTIFLGGLIVTTMIMGADAGTMQHAAQEIVNQGTAAVEALDYTPVMP